MRKYEATFQQSFIVRDTRIEAMDILRCALKKVHMCRGNNRILVHQHTTHARHRRTSVQVYS